MRQFKEANAPHVLAGSSCVPPESSNTEDFSSPPVDTLHGEELSSIRTTLNCSHDDAKVEATPQNAKPSKGCHNSATAGPRQTFSSKVTHDSITPAERREREAKASRHVAFNSTILCPLSNLGNTCYFNAGIQILSNCPAFVFGLRDAPHCYAACQKCVCFFNRSSNNSKHTLFRLLANLLYNMEYATLENGKAITPFRAVDQLAEVFPGFEGRRQQDCPEMINAVLVTIEDEHRLEHEVSDLLMSFDASAQAYEAETCMSIDKGTHIVGNQSIDLSEPFPSSGCIESCRRHALKDQTGSSSTCSRDALPGPRSAHFIAMLRLMQRVNEENRELEMKAAKRKGKAYDPQNSFIPPRLVFNPTTGGFKGYMVSEIRCHNCFSVSRVVDSFSSLILEIPSERQRYEFAKRNPNIKRLDVNGKPFPNRKSPDAAWWNPLSHLYHFYRRFYNYVFGCFSTVNYALTLEECLDIHFESVELNGGNRYQCESCGGLHEATKSEFLLSLPEYLFIQMKRFKMNTFSKVKKSDPVIFPVSWTPLKEGTKWEEIQKSRTEILDLRPYMHPTVSANFQTIQPCLQSNSINQDRDAKALGLSENQQVPSTYSLDGIVNHHGSLSSGHYTVFTHKVLNDKNLWLHINDEEIEAVSLESVADSEEYLLLYRCQPIVEPTEEFVRLRDKARYYLLESRRALQDHDNEAQETTKSCIQTRHGHHHSTEVRSETRKDGIVYISCAWLQRMAFFHDPGPIINKLCYRSNKHHKGMTNQIGVSTAGSRIPETLFHVYGPPVWWFYVEIDEIDYRAFYEAYGGDAAVTRAEYEALERDQNVLIELLQNKSD
ncbi:unnamed protein product [Phytomonas sp. EM1]|nr:unnamed protein product [Phytomonas sp. EM1]|eukprot:CCW62214.1 unnamed protein product [Phytomonas sp. isolate EM1]